VAGRACRRSGRLIGRTWRTARSGSDRRLYPPTVGHELAATRGSQGYDLAARYHGSVGIEGRDHVIPASAHSDSAIASNRAEICVAAIRAIPGSVRRRLVQQIAQPGFRGALREPAHWRAAALRPRRPDLLLDLPPVRQPVLRVPDRPARALDPEDVISGRTNSAHAQMVRHSRDILGTQNGRVARGNCTPGLPVIPA
jgi:hypothetical protein